ncbi:glutamate-ammonia-ligase adenylyltransferase [Stieleria marina]
MDSAENEPSSEPQAGADALEWLDDVGFRRIDQAGEYWLAIFRCGVSADLLDTLRRRLQDHFGDFDDPDAVLENLSGFVVASRSPIALLALFERDESALLSLLHVFATSQTLSQFLIDDPEGFDLMRASDGLPAQRRFLVDELVAEMRTVEDRPRAAKTIKSFVHRELVRIAYGEFVRNMSPDQTGRQLAWVADAAIESALEFASRDCQSRLGQPQRSDGGIPRVTVLGLSNYGGLELNYAARLDVVFLYDAIDEKNPSHQAYYRELTELTIELVGGPMDPTATDEPCLGFGCHLTSGPHGNQSLICSVGEAVDELESRNRTWQRMAFAKGRVVAGDEDVGTAFLQRAQPWIYHRFISHSDFDDVRVLRHKLERRTSKSTGGKSSADGQPSARQSHDVLRTAGGRRDIELTVQFLQLLHGAECPSVREANTTDALIALEKEGCLLHAESELLTINYARLCRLHHQLSVMFGKDTSVLPNDETMFRHLAWRLGMRLEDRPVGDGERFRKQLDDAFEMNGTVINHLMIDAPSVETLDSNGERVRQSIETELLLDVDASDELIAATLKQHGINDPRGAMENLRALSVESVRFLSPRRCRHFLAAIAPSLLTQIAKTPFPDQTLRSLVDVTDSLGAKATLWELLGANPPTMDLMVRLCASAEYLRRILIENPGMIDELIDSLLMNRLPSGDRLDAQSIELCRGADEVDLILKGFKNSAHLTIGVRDILNKESIESTHQALSDTAEAVVRRVIESEQDRLSQQYGDPVDETGQPVELLALALGKFGGREPNYHSDLDVIFLYSGKGETQRRVGGPRRTVPNHQFFNQLSERVISRIDRGDRVGQLYELDGRLRPTGDEGTLAVSIEDFLKRFEHDVAPLWQRLALCKARSISGSRRLRQSMDANIKKLIIQTRWHANMATEIRSMRMRMQETASPDNLKRAEGGTVDVDIIAQTLTLRHASESPDSIRQGTVAALDAMAAAGIVADSQAIELTNSYRTLRRIESRLRLLNTDRRHELPHDDRSQRNLAFLLGESEPAMIAAQSKQARHSIRKLFDEIFDSLSDG